MERNSRRADLLERGDELIIGGLFAFAALQLLSAALEVERLGAGDEVLGTPALPTGLGATLSLVLRSSSLARAWSVVNMASRRRLGFEASIL